MNEKLLKVECEKCCFQNIQLIDFRYQSGVLELILVLNSENKKIRLTFDWIHSFRTTDEGDLLKMQDQLDGQMTTGIYTVESSNYLNWFNDQSANIHDGDFINHYLIVTGDDVIEILSSVSPQVTFF